MSQVGGTHPPLFHVLMNLWISWFGVGETAIRSFALVFGVLSIPLAYWVGRVAYDRLVGLIAATIITFSPFNIWYSQEARMYTMLMFFALALGGVLRARARAQLHSVLGRLLRGIARGGVHTLPVPVLDSRAGPLLRVVRGHRPRGPAGPRRGAPGDVAPAAAAVRGCAARQGVVVGQRRARGRSSCSGCSGRCSFRRAVRSSSGRSPRAGSAMALRLRVWPSASTT